MQDMTMTELYGIACALKIKGRTKLKADKQAMIAAITEAKQEQQANPFEEVASTSELLEGLNAEQAEAVKDTEGAKRINAVAGAGKTRVLTNRVAYMINEKGIDPKSILMTTFTKKASEEMKSRLEKLISSVQLSEVVLGTTHSIGYRILKAEYSNLNHPLRLAFSQELLINYQLKKFATEVRKGLLKDYSVDKEIKKRVETMGLKNLLSVISVNKSKGITPKMYHDMIKQEDYAPNKEAYHAFYKAYEEKKWFDKRIDTDDLLFLLVQLFEEHPAILAKYQRRFKYLLVDEAQDNNLQQYKLIKMLAYPENNVFIVGDDDQSLYGFRGASPQSFMGLTKQYQSIREINLVKNYRSEPVILHTANKLIKHNQERIIKQLVPAKPMTDPKAVLYHHYENEIDEAEGVTSEIIMLTEQEKIDYKKIAVLFRTNAQSMSIENSLIMKGIPYILHGGVSFYERKETKDILAYFQLAQNKHNNEAFKRVYNTPTRYLGKAFIGKLESIRNASLYEATDHVTLKPYEYKGVQDFKSIIESMEEMKQDDYTLVEMLDYLLKTGGYLNHIKDEDGDEVDNSKEENIATFRFLLSSFDTLDEFLHYIEKLTGKAKHSINGVQLMTIHKSKGLEFDTVFSIGQSEGLLPHYRAIEAAEIQVAEGKKPLAIEEERRMSYVAVTRAERKCYISSLDEFNGKPSESSRFIFEMGLHEDFQTSDK